jgi:PAS domain-containing protein
MAYPRWPFISIVVWAVLLAVVLAVFRTKLRTLDVFSAFLLFGAAVLSVLIVLYTRSLRRAQQIQLDTEERLQEMADNIQEIVWMIDAETKKALYVNAAYETITGLRERFLSGTQFRATQSERLAKPWCSSHSYSHVRLQCLYALRVLRSKLPRGSRCQELESLARKLK